MIIALAGGVGGAKLVNGLARILAPEELVVVVNTGDDFTHLGLRISPDLDTVMYTLAGRNNTETGWGLAGETWGTMAALERLGAATWFRLGDADLATHLERTRRLNAGETLSFATAELCSALGAQHRVVPMTDDVVQTVVDTNEGRLLFQDYFVRRRCEPAVAGVDFIGLEHARPSEGFQEALSSSRLTGMVICPSNPYLSIQPILALEGVRTALETRRVPVVAVSPIIGGAAVKGPAAKIMRELGRNPSVLEIARLYQGIIDGLIVDERDRGLRTALEASGVRVRLTDTMMKTPDDQLRVAMTALEFATSIRLSSGGRLSC